MIRLNKNSIFSKLYIETYLVDSLPKDFCTYFWKMLIAFVIIPFTFWHMLLRRFKPVDKESLTARIILGIVINGMILVFILKPIASLQFAVTLLFFAIVVSLLIGIIYLLAKIRNKKETKKSLNNAKEAIKGFKEKYCPLITWEEE